MPARSTCGADPEIVDEKTRSAWPFGGSFNFTPDNRGRISGFALSSARINNLYSIGKTN
jgi:hypothetical protein